MIKIDDVIEKIDEHFKPCLARLSWPELFISVVQVSGLIKFVPLQSRTRRELSVMWGLDHLVSDPLSPNIFDYNESGTSFPTVLTPKRLGINVARWEVRSLLEPHGVFGGLVWGEYWRYDPGSQNTPGSFWCGELSGPQPASHPKVLH